MASLLIVEDEPIIAFDLRLCVEQAGHTVLGVVDTAKAAQEFLETALPDLLILDINLKGSEDGISLARKLSPLYDIPFIFITSYFDEQTLGRVKEVNPAAYLVKPFREEDVIANIQLAIRKRAKQQDSATPSKLFVRENGVLRPIKAEEVQFARGESNYTVLYMISDRKITLSHTLRTIEDKLPVSLFCRVHKSYLINLEFIDLIEHSIVVVGGETIPIGKAFRAGFFNKMQIL